MGLAAISFFSPFSLDLSCMHLYLHALSFFLDHIFPRKMKVFVDYEIGLLYIKCMAAPTGRIGSFVWDVRAKVIPFSGTVIKLIESGLDNVCIVSVWV